MRLINKNGLSIGFVGGIIALVLGILLVTGALSLDVILGIGLIVIGALALINRF